MTRRAYLKFILPLITLFFLTSATTPNYSIMLNGADFYLPVDVSKESLSGYSADGFVYRLIQFNAIPTQERRKSLEKTGVVLMDYIPNFAYYAAIPVGLDASVLLAHDVRSVAVVTPAMKQTPAVLSRQLPDWSILPNGDFVLIVAMFQHVQIQNVVSELQGLGIEFQPRPSRGFYRLVVPQHKLLAVLNHPLIYYVQEDEEPGEPENFRARTNHRVNTIQGNYVGARMYDGAGVVVSIGDDGDIGPHIDYAGRLTSFAGPSQGNHGDHVAGTVFGAGNLDPRGRGMAPAAEVVYYNYFRFGNFHFDGIDTQYVQLGVRITQSSYSNGNNTGYTSLARQMDEDILQNRALNHVFSAGNAGTANHGYGAGPGWGNITGGHKQGKNVIATGNVTWNDAIASSSSRGPAHDGRIKPDVCAVGTDVFSTVQPQGYDNFTGTSMAAPGVSGAMATMYQAFRSKNNQQDPDGGLMKAILMNTADDLGNAGPDFIYGYGRINILRAITDIDSSNFIIDSITQGQSNAWSISVPSGLSELRVMVYWSDHMASAGANRALVNNINFNLSKDGTTWLPWVLDPTPNPVALNSLAVRGIDSLNNVEQVTLANPSAGEYAVNISGAAIPQGPQKYYIVYSFVRNEIKLTHPIGGEHFTPGTAEIIRWDAPAGTGNFTLQYSLDSGATYQNINTAVNANARSFSWNVPQALSGRAMIRISRGAQNSTSEAAFSIIGKPANLNIVWACPDSLFFTWNAVAGATGYEISMLGQKYMDSIDFSSVNSIVLKGINPTNERYLSVRALGPNGARGERANAFRKAPGTFNCQLTTDVSIERIKGLNFLPACQSTNNFSYTIVVRNEGVNSVSNIPVAFSLGAAAIFRDTIVASIAPGAVVEFPIQQAVSFSGTGIYSLRAFVELPGDLNSYNDTILQRIDVYNSTGQAVPHTQSFTTWTNCAATTNCENTVCNLAGGWINVPNITNDDIDWRTFSGNTATASTGPNGDNTTGNGRYLYLESSACFVKEAILISPCFNLSTVSLPQASIYYNMYGASMGELHVDVLADGEWIEDFVAPIIGDQGQGWKKWSFNLFPLAGKQVNFYFRGITGASFYSDIALDDFNIEQVTSVPSPQFTVSKPQPCPNQVVTLIDQSAQVPQQWKWTITPATYNFVNGTSDTSQFPQVSFTALGTYTIQLRASNVNGADSITLVNVVQVTNGAAIPIIENFDFTAFAPQGWSVINPDNNVTWQLSTSVAGSNGVNTLAAFMNNFNYNAIGQEDALQTMTVELSNITSAHLVFDVAYARRSATQFDALRIDISTDCGTTFTPSGYFKSGSTLATVVDLSNAFQPVTAGNWRTDSINLTPYLNNNIAIRFVAINGNGNNLYIDNINIIEGGVAAPVAQFTVSTADICVGVPVIFTSTSTGVVSGYSWNFGNNATPATANSAGPHSVVYSTGGPKTVALAVQNSGGGDVESLQFLAKINTVADFSTANTGSLAYTFTDLSSPVPTSWLWDFGDGNFTTTQNPTHTYTTGGNYNITLISDNGCGPDTITKSLFASGIGLNEWNLTTGMLLMPNPTAGYLVIKAQFEKPHDLKIELLDVTGKLLLTKQWSNAAAGNNLELNLDAFADGVYLLRINSAKSSATHRVVLQR